MFLSWAVPQLGCVYCVCLCLCVLFSEQVAHSYPPPPTRSADLVDQLICKEAVRCLRAADDKCGVAVAVCCCCSGYILAPTSDSA